MGWDPLGDLKQTVANIQNAINIGLPTLGTVGDKINQTAGMVKDISGTIVDRAIVRPATELYGELSGSNAQRQQDWQNRVAADAEAARVKDIADRNTAAQNADLAASNAAKSSRVPRGAGGTNFNFRAPGGPDITDFLGL